MIPRYEETNLSHIWTDQRKFELYLQVELAVTHALEGKIVPQGLAQKIRENVQIKPERITEIEQTTKHDVIAFCTSITEQLTDEEGRFFHYGVTSSDIIDTALSLQVKESLELILPAFKQVCETLKQKATETKELVTMGRSHGMFAEPMSFGQKFLSFYAEFSRRYQELEMYYQKEITGQLSGAVGNYTILNTQIEEQALKELGLKPDPISTQVIPRDRLAKLVSLNALTASAIERVAVEIRHLHHSDIGELAEGFAPGQKGSSIMPHKKNPISGENLTGMARVLRSHLSIALDNITLWHERDISHSSAERLYLPDNLGLMLYALKRLNSTLQNLVLHKEVIEKKVKENFGYLSSYYLHFFIRTTQRSREELYKILQAASFEAKTPEEFHHIILKQAQDQGINCQELPNLDFQEIKKIYMKEVDKVFKRTL